MPNLVGIGNSQVPTNAMLGGLAYQDSVGEINFEKIKARTGDTAVDVFVYDTSKDSDGGAWRHRTQDRSWYDEGVSATRGARKEFPAVAIIVAENDEVTIYDGDDPNCPMWMVFKAGGGNGANMIGRTSENTNCVSMLNGLMCVGRTSFGLHMINFIADRARFKESGYDTPYILPIGTNRNGGNAWLGANVDGQDLVHDTVHAVAMSVQRNAPIDSATGLPIPTIVVGTTGGMSLIRDDGRVVDYGSFAPVTFVAIGKDAVVGAVDTSGIDYIFKTGLAQKDENYDVQILSGTGNYYMNSNTGTTPLLRDLNISAMTFNPSDTTVYRGGDDGLDIITETDTVSNSVSNPLIAYVDINYNSGYMVGDIKGAFLSDTDDTNVTELVNNNQFNNGITGWTTLLNGASGGSPGITVVSNKLRFQQGSSNSVWLEAYQDITTIVGKKYLLNIDIASTNTSANWRIYAPSSSKILGYPSYLNQGQHSATFTATSTTTRIRIQQGGSANTVGEVNSVSVKLVDDDRSINDNYLTVFGTIEKHAVAEGAELVGYRPDNSSMGINYLKLSLTSSIFDLTGDWSIVFWARNNGNYAANYAGWEIAPDDISSNNAYSIIPLSMYFDTGGVMGLRGMNGNANQDATGTPFATVGAWRCVNVVQRGGITHLYIDGRLDKTRTVTYTNPGSAYSLYIFAWSYSSSRYYGRRQIDFSLFRLSESALTEEQVQRIYNDEKQLFQNNAKCTISGANSTVTALGFDDSTNTAYVGTASGRSDFRGLKRINNTTTAVTTAISASNGLVAEQ